MKHRAPRKSSASTRKRRAVRRVGALKRRLEQLLARLDDPGQIEAALAEIEAKDGSERSDSSESAPFVPTRKMLAYLLKYRQLMAANRPFTQRAVANESDVHEDVVSRWHRVPGFDEWWAREVDGESDRLLPMVRLAVVRRAIRTGDPRDAEMAHRLRGALPGGNMLGPFGESDAAPSGAAPFVLNLLVPRPEPTAATPPLIEVRAGGSR